METDPYPRMNLIDIAMAIASAPRFALAPDSRAAEDGETGFVILKESLVDAIGCGLLAEIKARRTTAEPRNPMDLKDAPDPGMLVRSGMAYHVNWIDAETLELTPVDDAG